MLIRFAQHGTGILTLTVLATWHINFLTAHLLQKWVTSSPVNPIYSYIWGLESVVAEVLNKHIRVPF